MKETRAGKYGRTLAVWINYTLENLPGDRIYKVRFLKELKRYSLEPRKKGSPRNEGCVHELADLVDVDLSSPEQFACLVKEGIHLMYQKQTASRVLNALLETLKNH